MQLMEHLPESVYNNESHVVDFQGAIEAELTELLSARDDLMNQILPARASWGLERFEQEYGIAAEAGISEGQRLARWRAKRRGRGTSTLEVIRAAAQCFFKDPVKVMENPEQYCFWIEAAPRDEECPDWKGLSTILWGIKPAHLSHAYRLEIYIPVDAGARVNLVRVGITTGFNVFGITAIYWDSTYIFDGIRTMSAEFEKGPRVPSVGVRFAEKGSAACRETITIGVHAINSGALLLKGAALHMKHNVFGLTTIYWDSAFLFDGSKTMDGEFEHGPHFVCFAIKTQHQVACKQQPFLCFGGTIVKSRLAVRFPAGKLRSRIHCAARQSWSGKVAVRQTVRRGISAGAIYNTMWCMDGSKSMDGSRKCNADIIHVTDL